MFKLEDIDKNFKIESALSVQDIKWHNVRSEPFKIYGVKYNQDRFERMPREIAEKVSDGVKSLYACTAGGRVKFKTDSPYMAVHVKGFRFTKMCHFALTGSIGLDLYKNVNGQDVFVKSFVPPLDVENNEWEFLINNLYNDEETLTYTIHMPLYGAINELYVGFKEGSVIERAEEYSLTKPIVYYGSSITQGGCASRAGNAYSNIISRKLSCDHINLGFSGCACAEDLIIDHIKSLEMSLFVLDYDYNAPSVEHLKQTHEKFALAVRQQHPNLPIIMLTRPKTYLTDDEPDRLNVIKNTYENFIKRGDKNVYFISGAELMKYTDNEGTVDNVHPTDFGFHSIAKVLGAKIKEILGL